ASMPSNLYEILALAMRYWFALLGGLGGAVFAGWYTERRLMAEMEALRDSLPVITTTGSKADEVAEEEEHTESAMQHLSSDLSTNVGDKQLTPTEVYEAYVGSTVGISNEGTFTNLFGQVSETASTGSGFIITSDGYIVTNYHVIENAVKLTVTLNNEEQYEAAIIGYDSSNDIALIKIDAADLRPVSIGDSDELRVGETVCAIGNPLGELTNTLTIGGVSALDREVNTDGTPINMMQTDCAINSGNSGGPLFDMNGNVIGITTAKYYGDAIEGIGFAIPINDAMRIVADLKEYGYVKGQPYMGVTVMDMNTSTAQLYKLPVGVYVNSVDPGSGAEIAGMQEGDIILALGEYEVVTMSDLMGVLKNFAAGDTTTILIYRTGEELLLTITFDEKRPAELTQQTAAETPKMPSVDEFFPEEPKD
ncbi:MAG: trypsin-like serine protease, partial [Erysipelotrichaceae bacterium]|nr:trypsin-like serine protease [Erysipelotrichaceae bacterium]